MNINPVEYDEHRKVVFIKDEAFGIEGFISIHRDNNGHPSFGATRIFNYSSIEEALNDSLRLSRLMTYKSLLAGLPYGGAKAVLLPPNPKKIKRENFLQRYAEIISDFGGAVITGADIGVSKEDVKYLKKFSPYFVGIHTNPVKFTVNGIVESMKCAVERIFGSTDLQNRSVAIQGLGKIGSELISQLYGKVALISACDIDPVAVTRIQKKYPKVNIVSPKKIYSEVVDIFSPCAMYGTLNTDSIPLLRCKLIVGGANNQLASESVGEKIQKKGILYSPDFITNSGGLISVTEEFEHESVSSRRIQKKIKSIQKSLTKIFDLSEKNNEPTNSVAIKVAQQMTNDIFSA